MAIFQKSKVTFSIIQQGIFLLALVGLLYTSLSSSVQLFLQLRQSAAGHELHSDAISQFEKRLETLKELLPEHEVVGYLGDGDIPGVESNSGQFTEFILTQYYLAPRVIEKGANHHFIIGNFRQSFEEYLQPVFHVRMVDNLGFGFYLLESTEK